MVCHNLTCNSGVFLTSTCFLDGPQFPGLFRTFNGSPLSMEAYCFRDLLLFIQFTPILWTFYNPLLFYFSSNLSTYLECIGTDLVRDKFKFRKKDGTYTKNKGVVVEAQKICICPMSQTLQSSYVTNFAFIRKKCR